MDTDSLKLMTTVEPTGTLLAPAAGCGADHRGRGIAAAHADDRDVVDREGLCVGGRRARGHRVVPREIERSVVRNRCHQRLVRHADGRAGCGGEAGVGRVGAEGRQEVRSRAGPGVAVGRIEELNAEARRVRAGAVLLDIVGKLQAVERSTCRVPQRGVEVAALSRGAGGRGTRWPDPSRSSSIPTRSCRCRSSPCCSGWRRPQPLWPFLPPRTYRPYRTVAGRSTRKSAGSVAVAVVPIESNVCEYGMPVGIPMSARTTARTAKTVEIVAHTSRARGRLEPIEATSDWTLWRKRRRQILHQPGRSRPPRIRKCCVTVSQDDRLRRPCDGP